MVLQKQTEVHYNHYTGKQVSETDSFKFKRMRFNGFLALMIVMLYNFYLEQRDLITYAIRNRMIARQQSDLLQYFETQESPIIITDNEGKLVFNNSACHNLFGQNGLASIELDAQLFTSIPPEEAF